MVTVENVSTSPFSTAPSSEVKQELCIPRSLLLLFLFGSSIICKIVNLK